MGMPKVFLSFLRGDFLVLEICSRNMGDDFPANRANFSLEIAHTGLPGVGADDLLQASFCEADLARAQSVLAYLARNQITVRNGDLFFIRITRQGDNFHPVTQRARDRLQ